MAENDWAIVIGINKYDFLPADDHLKYAVNDAVKVRQFCVAGKVSSGECVAVL